MKYGFMTFSYPEAGIADVVGNAARAGYTGIEVRIGAGHRHGLEIDAPGARRAEAVGIAGDAGIELYAIATSFKLAVDPLDEDTARATLKLAADLGAKVVRVFGGAFADVGIDAATARARLVEGLSRFGALARAEAGGSVTIALESHDAWTDPDELAAVLDEVTGGSPDVPAGLNWDAFHIVRTTGQGVAEHFPTIARHVKHVHVHDGYQRDGKPVLAPIGEGVVDQDEQLRALASIAYDGYLMGEWIHAMMDGETDPDAYLPRELAKLRSIEADL